MKNTKTYKLPFIKPENMVYVRMGDMNEKHYSPEILDRYKGVKRTGACYNMSHFRTYDWECNEYKIELKSRNCEFGVYSTTMIGYNKLCEWGNDESDKRYFFLFAFLDGFYEWELTQDNYDEFGGFDAVRTADDFKAPDPTKDYSTFNPEKLHLYIPTKNLTKISDKGCLVPDELKDKSKYAYKKSTGCLIKFK